MSISKCGLQTTTWAFSPHHKEPESRIYEWSAPDKIPRAHSEVTRIAPALPGRIAALIALSVPISVVLMATPPEETRNWADVDKWCPMPCHRKKRFRGSMPAFGSHQPQDRAGARA